MRSTSLSAINFEMDPQESDIDAILANAIREREQLLSHSELLMDFQRSIDESINGSRCFNQRLEGLAEAARFFSIKRNIPSRIANFLGEPQIDEGVQR
ncbi:MAG: hypothetical protein HQK66_07015 [Desulfamplus sp.]|nr:hypothetical protein [Desulfamplus sp.]